MKVLDEIDVLSRRMSAELEAVRNPPVSEAELDELKNLCGEVPSELRSLLTWRDGETQFPFVLGMGWRFLPCREIRERLLMLAGRSIGLTTDDQHIDIPDVWPESWIPFLDWNGSIFGVIDSTYGDRSPVLGIELQSGMVVSWGESLSVFLNGVLSQLTDTGHLSVDMLMASSRGA